MRRIMFLGMILLWAPVLWAQGKIQPLNVKVGLWETTTTMAVKGLPPVPPETLAHMTPEQRARYDAAMQKASQGQTSTHKSCVTQKDLDKDPFGEAKRSKCTRTVLTSTGSKMEFREVCDEGGGQKSDATVQLEALDSEHVKGTVHATNTGGGHTMSMNGNITAKWLGAVCPSTK